MLKREMNIADYDAELWQAMEQEKVRQEEHIELIASENYTSPRVMQAQGSQLTNKYAEGYPGKRYYGGCEYVDIVEQLAIDRAKELFGADYANVQPHSGSQANFAVYTVQHRSLRYRCYRSYRLCRSGKTSQRTQTENDYRWLLCIFRRG